MVSPRVLKLAEDIKVIAAEMLKRRIKDPRLGFVTITDVRLTGDTQNATVFYTVFGSPEEQAASAAALAVGLRSDPVARGQAVGSAARADRRLHPRRGAGERTPDRRVAGPGAPVGGREGRRTSGGRYLRGRAAPQKKSYPDEPEELTHRT